MITSDRFMEVGGADIVEWTHSQIEYSEIRVFIFQDHLIGFGWGGVGGD